MRQVFESLLICTALAMSGSSCSDSDGRVESDNENGVSSQRQQGTAGAAASCTDPDCTRPFSPSGGEEPVSVEELCTPVKDQTSVPALSLVPDADCEVSKCGKSCDPCVGRSGCSTNGGHHVCNQWRLCVEALPRGN
jgi:hypothetical protein